MIYINLFTLSFASILVLASCLDGSKKKDSGFQTSCHKGEFTHKTKLTESEMSAYAIQLPPEIHADAEKSMRDRKLIETVVIIRGCLDIDLVSCKGIVDRMKVRLNLTP